MNRHQLQQLNLNTPDFSVRQRPALNFSWQCRSPAISELLDYWGELQQRTGKGCHSSCAGQARLRTSFPGLGQPTHCSPRPANARWPTATRIDRVSRGLRVLTCLRKAKIRSGVRHYFTIPMPWSIPLFRSQAFFFFFSRFPTCSPGCRQNEIQVFYVGVDFFFLFSFFLETNRKLSEKKNPVLTFFLLEGVCLFSQRHFLAALREFNSNKLFS